MDLAHSGLLKTNSAFFSKPVHKWLDASRKQVIIELVNLGPVIVDFAGFEPDGTQNVVEDGMEADVAEAQFIDGLLELPLAIIANECARKVGPHRQVEEPVERLGCLRDIELNVALTWLRRSR
jgi:hypothetical protein